MPTGLRNSPATFQALMNLIFRDYINELLVIYLDNIFIFSDSHEEHLKLLRLVLSGRRERQLYVGKEEYKLMKKETEFL